MFELQGQYAKATVLTDDVDDETVSQVMNVLNQPMFEGQKIVIQPIPIRLFLT
jgi:tRNA-splicing ligase RtcB